MLPEEENKLLQKKVLELKRKEYLPQAMLDLLSEVYSEQIKAREEAVVAAPPLEELPDFQRRLQGAPLVERFGFPYDAKQAKALFAAFLELVCGQQAPLKTAGEVIRDALAQGDLDLDAAFQAYLAGDLTLVDAWAARTPEAPRTFAFLVQSSLMPSLAAAADALAPERDKIPNWLHGHCPTCGSLPLISVLVGKEGFRHFTCSFCQTDYRSKRIGCPICGEQDFEKLSFYTVEDEPGFRVDLCHSCKRYIKTADFRSLDRRFLPLMDDLASLALDLIAAKKGYSRPTLSAWGF